MKTSYNHLNQFLFLLSLIFLANNGITQNEKQIDSLRNVVNLAAGQAKVEPMESLLEILLPKYPQEAHVISSELEQIARQYNLKEKIAAAWLFQARAYQLQANFDSLKAISLRGIRLAQSIKDDYFKGRFYNNIGIFHEKAGSIDSALYYYHLAVSLGMNDWRINNNIGLAYNNKGAFRKGIEHLEIALQGVQHENNIAAEAIISNNIGNAHQGIGNQEKAEYYFRKSIDLKDQLGDKRGKLFALSNLLGLDLPESETEESIEMGLKIAEEINDPLFLPIFLIKKAHILNDRGQWEEALDIAHSLYHDTRYANVSELNVLTLLTQIHSQLGDLESAENYGLELLALASESNHFRIIQNAKNHLLHIYESTGNYKRYYEIASDYYPVKDSIDRKSMLEKLAQLDNQLKNLEQEREIESLNNDLRQKQIRRNWIIVVAIFIAFTLSLILYFRSQQVKVQKKANRELKALDEMKTRFFTNISHELRTPVTLIFAPVEQILLKYSQQLSMELKESLGIVRNNSKKLLYLVEELLELSRIDAGKKELEATATPLESFSKQLFSAYESGALMKQIDYSFHYEPAEKGQVLVDKKRLEKIINNLLSNAIKFTPNGGKVALRVRSDERKGERGKTKDIVVEVADTGRGIAPEDLPHIFNRYYQTKRKDIAIEGGTGIGLALAKELAALMEGSLSVESEWGKGSTFILRFPAKEAEQKMHKTELLTSTVASSAIGHVEKSVRPKPVVPVQKQGKILIVEDNLDMQKLMFSLLSETYECLFANNGEEAWNLLKMESPSMLDIDLILSDIMMPKMDGYELLDKIKNHNYFQQVPVIMLTARAAEEDKLQALRMGVDDYLTKPFSPDELLARTVNLIHNYRQRQTFNKTNSHPVDIEFAATISADQAWLKELQNAALVAIEKKLELNATYLSQEVALSTRQLLRRLKSLTGLSTTDYIQEVKLQKARHLLENKAYQTISEVAYASGFSTSSYFTKVFKKHFGKLPGDYLETSSKISPQP